jgi:tRNA1(Val) A37 N6-methylase TrmN6
MDITVNFSSHQHPLMENIFEQHFPEGLSFDFFLEQRLRLLQPIKGFRSGSDAVFLAQSFPFLDATQTHIKVLDVGCGIGAVGLCIAKQNPQIQVFALDIQESYVQLAQKNAEINQLESQFKAVSCNLENILNSFEADSFDFIVSNPPYFDYERSRKPEHEPIAMARHSQDFNIQTWIRKCLSVLKNWGYLTLVFPTERLDEVMRAVEGRAGNISIYPLWSQHKKRAKLMLFRCQKASKAPLTLHFGQIVHEQASLHTEDAIQILKGNKRIDLTL